MMPSWSDLRSPRAAPSGLALTLASGVVAGVIATIAKGHAESLLQPIAEKVWPVTPAGKRVPGADPADHPDKMPPGQIAARAVDAVCDAEPADDDVAAVAATLHWGMGLGSAVAYAVVSARYPRLRVGLGAPAGLVLYATTHGSSLPLAGLQPAPWKMPRAAVAWEAASHVVYGIALELVLSVEDHVSRR